MHVCLKSKIQSDGSIDKVKLIIVVRGNMQNKELVGDTWSPIASMSNLKYFLADPVNHKARAHQLYIYWSNISGKIKNRVFVKLDSRYVDYFPEY